MIQWVNLGCFCYLTRSYFCVSFLKGGFVHCLLYRKMLALSLHLCKPLSIFCIKIYGLAKEINFNNFNVH